MKKKTNLDSGFLFLYDWLPVLEQLPLREVGALFVALVKRQRNNEPLPTFRNPLTGMVARMIEPVIIRRLEGAEWAKKGREGAGTPVGVPTQDPIEDPDHFSREERKTEENRTDDLLREAPPPLRALSEQEKEVLRKEGMPTAYLDMREVRAVESAAKQRKAPVTVLLEWWRQDKRRFLATQRTEQESSFDADEFWEAAVNKTYEGLL